VFRASDTNRVKTKAALDLIKDDPDSSVQINRRFRRLFQRPDFHPDWAKVLRLLIAFIWHYPDLHLPR